MASSYSNSLKIQLMANGEDSNTWGTITNTNWNLIEQAVTGVQTITMSNANYTLSNLNGVSDEARNMVLVVNGANSAIRQIVAPLVNKFYVISNQTTGGYAITIGGSSGSLITVPNGTTVQVYCDGTNFYSAQTSSAGDFNVNGNETVSGNLTVNGTTNIIPAGVIQMWPTASAPTGFLLCNGASVSTSTYANLFSAIGYTFGGSGGSFLLPNYADRMPIGVGSIATAIAATGGASTTTLSGANLPSHTHSFSGSGSGSTSSAQTGVYDAGHSHTTNVSNSGGGSGPWTVQTNPTYQVSTNSAQANIQDPGHAHGFSVSVSGTTGSAGSSTAATTISPYLGINFIIKT